MLITDKLIKLKKILFFLILLISNYSQAQTKYPADTTLTSKNVPIYKKAIVLPISLWQRFSYNVPILNCQFTPSCSNYAVESISKRGVFLGTAMTTDRIIRCNPFALYYFQKDNNLTDIEILPYYNHKHILDTVPSDSVYKINKYKINAICLSMIAPGSGRIYLGRFWDGLFSFVLFSLSSYNAYQSYQNGQNIKCGMFGTISFAFYIGEIYGVNRYANQKYNLRK